MKSLDYSKQAKKHFFNPKYAGEIKNPSSIGEVGNPSCLLPDEKIWANDELLSMQDILKDSEVISHEGKKEKIIQVFKRNYKGKIVILKNALGILKLTPEHLVYALKVPKETKFLRTKNKKSLMPAWYHAEQLKKRDIILYPFLKNEEDCKFLEININKLKYDFRSKEIPNKITLNEELLRLFGYYLSEGNVQDKITKTYVSFSLNINEKDIVEDIRTIVKNLFSLEIKTREIPEKKGVVVYIYNAKIARWLKFLFGNGAKYKKIPKVLMNLPTEKQKALIYAMWKGDGYVNLNRNGPRAGYSTISYDLVQQLKVLLLRQKIVPSYYKEKEKIVRNVKHQDSYRIHVGQRESLIKLCKILGIVYSPNSYSAVDSWFDESHLYTPITKIETKNYDGKVYNLEVENSHSFISSSFTVHNCGDVMRVYLKITLDKKTGKEKIEKIRFKTMGCIAAIASSDVVCELAEGKTLEQAKKITRKDILKKVGGLPLIKHHCSLLGEEALNKAIENYKKK